MENEEISDHLIAIKAIATKIAKIAEHMKNITREIDKDPIEVEAFSILPQIEEVLRTQSANNNVKISFNKIKNSKIVVNSCSISQGILNLLMTSLHSIKKKEMVYGEIEISFDFKNNTTEIIIKDSSGKGEKDVPETAFSPFINTQPSEGLGLSMVLTKQLIEGNGGKIFYKIEKEHFIFIIKLGGLPI
jgi:C4-dicarboxylate-specific signal transduction histidine kinase